MKKLGKGTESVLENRHTLSFTDCTAVEKVYLNLGTCKQVLSTDTLQLGVNEVIKGRNTAVILALPVPPLRDDMISTVLVHKGTFYELL